MTRQKQRPPSNSLQFFTLAKSILGKEKNSSKCLEPENPLRSYMRLPAFFGPKCFQFQNFKNLLWAEPEVFGACQIQGGPSPRPHTKNQTSPIPKST